MALVDGVLVKDQVIAASQFMAGENGAAYRALFAWLPRPDIQLAVTDTAALTSTPVNMTAAVDTNVIAVEVVSPAGATNAVCVFGYDVAATQGTTAPLFVIKVPAAGRIVVPFFDFQNGKPGLRSQTRLSVAAVTTADSMATNPAAADRPNVRTIALAA